MVLMDTKPEYGDYIGEDRLLCCSVCQCHMPKEAYFSEGQALFGHDRHPSECECRRKEREIPVRMTNFAAILNDLTGT